MSVSGGEEGGGGGEDRYHPPAEPRLWDQTREIYQVGDRAKNIKCINCNQL